jgi:hypothetical protein
VNSISESDTQKHSKKFQPQSRPFQLKSSRSFEFIVSKMIAKQQINKKAQVVGSQYSTSSAKASKKSSSNSISMGKQTSVYFCILVIAIAMIALCINCIQAEASKTNKKIITKSEANCPF